MVEPFTKPNDPPVKPHGYKEYPRHLYKASVQIKVVDDEAGRIAAEADGWKLAPLSHDWPRHLHKPDGQIKIVFNREEQATAEAEGWVLEPLVAEPLPDADVTAEFVDRPPPKSKSKK